MITVRATIDHPEFGTLLGGQVYDLPAGLESALVAERLARYVSEAAGPLTMEHAAIEAVPETGRRRSRSLIAMRASA